MVPEHPNSGELELFIMPRPCLGNAKKNASCLPTILLVLRGVGSGQPTNNKHLEQQSGFGAAACRHAGEIVDSTRASQHIWFNEESELILNPLLLEIQSKQDEFYFQREHPPISFSLGVQSC